MLFKYTPLILCLIAPFAWANNTYGYLGFWHNPHDSRTVPQTKTTRENNSLAEAEAEMQQFCSRHDQILPDGTTGCFALTPIQNTCAAAAWSHKRGLMRPDNVYIATHADFHQVGKIAYKLCKQNNGWFARCEVETVYCSSSEMYPQK